MQTRKPLSLVYKRRKQTTQTQNNATSLFRLQTQTTQETKNKNKSIQYKTTNYLLTNLTSKQSRIAGETVFFSQTESKRINKTKNNYPKQNQHRNRKAETYTMKIKQNNRRKITSQKWKQLGLRKGMLGKFVSKKQANLRKGKGKKKKNKRNQK